MIEKRTRVITPEGWSENQRGDFFENIVSRLFERQHFRVATRVRFTGMEIDVLLDHCDTNQRAYAECKFHKDPLSATILYALLGKANQQQVPLAYLVSTASLGKEAQGVLDERQRSAALSPTLAFIGPDKLTDWFMDIEGLKLPDLESFGIPLNRVGTLTLIVRPTNDRFWVIEEKTEGIPTRAIVQSLNPTSEADIDVLRADFDRLGLWQGLEIVDINQIATSNEATETSPPSTSEEVVTAISMAERFDDYRPCRPEDFVGRAELQKNVWDFLTQVETGASSTRIVSFVGPSGFGKSSVILKLTDRFRNQKWKNKFYLYPIDVRSARGPMFVAKALRLAFQSAVNDGFIEPSDTTIQIDSADSLLQSTSIQTALADLEKNERVLVVFFDQFEELFAKEPLLQTFEQFRRLAFEVDSAKSNLVLGFSWRTGITFSEDHPAYYLWQNLRDKRLEFRINEFDTRESSLLINQFEKHTGLGTSHQLRRRLLEQCQGFPWLLKKLCIHVFDELKKGAKSNELLAMRLNIKRLFDQDLEPLTREENACLKYIAENSPADMIDVIDLYGQETVNKLSTSRLIVRTGQKYAVYWDVFREYLVNGTVPIIPLTYMPTCQLSTALKTLVALQNKGPSEVTQLCEKLGFTEKTMVNVLADLEAFNLASRKGAEVRLNNELQGASMPEIAAHLATQLNDHVILKKVTEEYGIDEKISIDEFKSSLALAYPAGSYRAETIGAYANRIIQWLSFAGIVETEIDGVIVNGDGQGKAKGVISRSALGRIKRPQPLFLCASGPTQAIELVSKLFAQKEISRHDIESSGFRNSAYDLIALGLAQWTGNKLHAGAEIIHLPVESSLESSFNSLIVRKALQSPFLVLLSQTLESAPHMAVTECGALISKSLGLNWSESSAKRYVNAGKTWLAHANPGAEQLSLFSNVSA